MKSVWLLLLPALNCDGDCHYYITEESGVFVESVHEDKTKADIALEEAWKEFIEIHNPAGFSVEWEQIGSLCRSLEGRKPNLLDLLPDEDGEITLDLDTWHVGYPTMLTLGELFSELNEVELRVAYTYLEVGPYLEERLLDVGSSSSSGRSLPTPPTGFLNEWVHEGIKEWI